MEEQLSQIGTVVLGLMADSSLDQETSDASGDGADDQDGGEGRGDTGVSLEGSTRMDSPLLREDGLITTMEREAEEAGAGRWFNRMDQGIPESWSGPNSDMSASQDQVQTTVLTTIGSQTLPNPVRVPDNLTQPGVLRSLMEGPVRL